jgi:hypothetical protein
MSEQEQEGSKLDKLCEFVVNELEPLLNNEPHKMEASSPPTNQEGKEDTSIIENSIQTKEDQHSSLDTPEPESDASGHLIIPSAHSPLPPDTPIDTG